MYLCLVLGQALARTRALIQGQSTPQIKGGESEILTVTLSLPAMISQEAWGLISDPVPLPFNDIRGTLTS